jgi:hypothetical protein
MFANVTMWVRSKPLNIALLVFMLAGYPVVSFMEFLRWAVNPLSPFANLIG